MPSFIDESVRIQDCDLIPHSCLDGELLKIFIIREAPLHGLLDDLSRLNTVLLLPILKILLWGRLRLAL